MKLSLTSMGAKRSSSAYLNLEICSKLFLSFLLIYAARLSVGVTNPGDVAAINSLHTAMGSPALPGWVGSGGDPCGEGWQGVACNGSDIQSIVLNAANLGGELGENLGNFASIKSIDLSNNHIGGSIPSNLPVTMQNFFLSANQFSGSIPDSLSSLTLLTDMSLNNNLLSGEIPDAFQTLTGLINLDLSSNNLSGELPPSLENLSRLTTLHLQENRLSGTLDVLQDLPLRDLNIENNLFSGPIPDQMLSIPIFRKDGNPFNTAVAPLPPTQSPASRSPSTVPPRAPTPPGAPSFWHTPGRHADGPSSSEESNGGTRKFWTKKKVVWISIAGVMLFIIMALGFVLFMPRCNVRREEADGASKRHRVGEYGGHRENPRDNGSMTQSTNQIEKVPNVGVTRPKEDHQIEKRRAEAAPKQHNEQDRNVRQMSAVPKREDHSIDMGEYDMILMPPPRPSPPPPPPPPPPAEKVIVRPILPTKGTTAKPSSKAPKIIPSARSFTIAALQQYTNSFSQENLIGGGMLGNVYRAQLPDGKLLAVKKLDKRASDQQKDDEFLELVNNIGLIRHANVVELVGYCAEHGQRLLIYEYCSNGTLQDALHSDDELRKKLSWNTRIRMALGAARALEYLHEICQPPVVHRNFKSVNVLLDDDLSIRVSDCGLAPLISKGSVSQLSGHLLSAYGYGAPEFESGIYTYQSDVYSFGVVLLELLTGRKSYDRTRNRGEQLLVRWAIPQLHDIDALSRMIDSSLNGEYTAKSLSHFADIISRCVQSEPEFRPPMSEVVQDLKDMMRRECSGNETNGD